MIDKYITCVGVLESHKADKLHHRTDDRHDELDVADAENRQESWVEWERSLKERKEDRKAVTHMPQTRRQQRLC